MSISIFDIREEERFDLMKESAYYRLSQKIVKENDFLKNIVKQKIKEINIIKSFLYSSYKSISEIKKVYIKINNKSIELIVVADKNDRKIKDKIFSIESKTMNEFQNYEFEFIIHSDSSDIENLEGFNKLL